MQMMTSKHKSEDFSQTFYHGTAAESDFTVFEGELVYLAPDESEARLFAENPILAKGKRGQARVLAIQAKPGRVMNIDEAVMNAILGDEDVDEVIEREARRARADGYRYLEFEHPGTNDGFTARIAIYPQEDLTIRF